ncbi:MAG: ATP-grasp domain-containing protein [Mogibacterium sp.]|nr:ATP-grasp domain-containing protein [Mogibacterium sp.]
MKKILILGAGIYQVPLIKAAKKIGLYTIVSSIPGNYPGFKYADKVYYVNTTDEEAVLELAKKENIDAVITAGTDVAVPAMARVCDELGLPGLSYEAAMNSSDKFYMKTQYEKYGVRTARFRKVNYDDADYLGRVSDFEYPMIVKAVDSSGSRGITRVDSAEEFPEAIARAKASSRADYYLIEEFIEGDDEFGAQGFVVDGELQFVLPHGDYLLHLDTGVPYGHYAPYELPDDIMKDLFEQTELCVKAMGIDNCPLNCDFLIKDGKVYVLEIAGRGGGANLMDLTAIFFGIDYHEMIVRCALGEKVSFDTGGDRRNPASYKGTANDCMMLRSDKDGRIVRLENNNDPEDPDILDIVFDYEVGDEVRKFRVSPDRLGHVITKGRTLAEAQAKNEEARSRIVLEVE